METTLHASTNGGFLTTVEDYVILELSSDLNMFQWMPASRRPRCPMGSVAWEESSQTFETYSLESLYVAYSKGLKRSRIKPIPLLAYEMILRDIFQDALRVEVTRLNNILSKVSMKD